MSSVLSPVKGPLLEVRHLEEGAKACRYFLASWLPSKILAKLNNKKYGKLQLLRKIKKTNHK